MFIQTKVSTLVRLSQVASDDAHRPYLHGVHIRTRRGTTGVLAEATNGHILAIENDVDGECDQNLIVHKLAIKAIERAARAIAKTKKIGADDLRVRIAVDRFAILTPTGQTELHPMCSFPPESVQDPFISGAFPDVERVIPIMAPDANPSTADCYNAELIAQLATSARGPKKPAAFVLYSPGIGQAARMRVVGAPNWMGVIMPMRADGASTCAAPTWFFGEGAKLQAAA